MIHPAGGGLPPTGITPSPSEGIRVTRLMIAAALWANAEVTRLTKSPVAPPTAGVPRGEVPRNVRPWREPVTTAPTTQTCDPPTTEKK